MSLMKGVDVRGYLAMDIYFNLVKLLIGQAYCFWSVQDIAKGIMESNYDITKDIGKTSSMTPEFQQLIVSIKKTGWTRRWIVMELAREMDINNNRKFNPHNRIGIKKEVKNVNIS